MAAHQSLHRPPIPALKVPQRPMTTPRSVSFSHSVFSPLPSTPSFLSPSPTPRSRSRPSETPAWLLLLLFHTLPLYVARSWLTSHLSSSTPSTTIIFTFLVLLSSSATFALLQEKQARTLRGLSITSTQWGLLLGNSILIATSVFLKLESVRNCGPLVAIMAEFSGGLLGRLVLEKSSKNSSSGSVRGFLVTILGIVLLSQGWTIESCSPLAIKDRLRMFKSVSETRTGIPKLGICGSFPVWPAIASGLMSCFVKLISTRTTLRLIPKKRVQGLSNVCATLIMLPLALFQLDSLFLAHTSALWPLICMLVLGLARSIMGDFYLEDRLMIPVGSSTHLFLTLGCSCLLELIFGMDISPLGFLLCSTLLFIGVRELPGAWSSSFSWDAIAQQEASDSFIRGPLRHIASDRKSRKIALFLAMNAAFMVVEFISGFMSNSLGLVSDACHMLFDCAALGIGLYASYISKLQPNLVFSYGYGRFEVLSGFANAVFLVLVASLIVLESIERILDPPEISTEKLLMVSIGGLLVNVVGLVFFHEEHHHAHHGHHHHEDHHSVPEKRSAHHDHHHQENHHHQVNHEAHHRHVEHSEHHHHPESSEHQHHHDHSHCDHQQGDHHHHDAHSNHQVHSHHDDSHCDHSDHQQGDHHHHDAHSNHQVHSHHDHSHCDHSDHQQGNHHHHHHDAHSNHQVHSHHDHEKLHNHDHHHNHDHDHHHDHNHDHHHHIDHNMRGIFLHVLADTLGSVGVVISTLLIEYKGWVFSDPVCSIFISAMIIASVIPLLKNSAEILLQRTPRAVEMRLHEALEKVRLIEGVAGFERLHVWSFTNSEIVGTLQVHALSSTNQDEIREKVHRLLTKLGITDVTIQVEEI